MTKQEKLRKRIANLQNELKSKNCEKPTSKKLELKRLTKELAQEVVKTDLIKVHSKTCNKRVITRKNNSYLIYQTLKGKKVYFVVNDIWTASLLKAEEFKSEKDALKFIKDNELKNAHVYCIRR